METRKKISNENDRRVKRTKRALRDALLKLLREKPGNQISVTELTNLADVNRATFYFYYNDIYDMLDQIQNEAIEFIEEEMKTIASVKPATKENFYAFIEKIVYFCRDNNELFRFVVSNDTNNTVLNRACELIFDNIPHSKVLFPKTDPRHYFTAYVTYAIIGVVINWYDDNMQTPPEQLAKFIADTYLDGAYSLKE